MSYDYLDDPEELDEFEFPEVDEMITQLEVDSECNKELNDWEKNFIESIGKSLHKYGKLTDKQQAKLESIYKRVSNKVFGRGS